MAKPHPIHLLREEVRTVKEQVGQLMPLLEEVRVLRERVEHGSTVVHSLVSELAELKEAMKRRDADLEREMEKFLSLEANLGEKQSRLEAKLDVKEGELYRMRNQRGTLTVLKNAERQHRVRLQEENQRVEQQIIHYKNFAMMRAITDIDVKAFTAVPIKNNPVIKCFNDIRGSDNRTPLCHTAKEGHLETMQLLPDHGADVNAKANYGRTSLHMAAVEGHKEVCKVLLSAGGDIDIGDSNNSTPLWRAAKEGHLETVKVLVDQGADVSAKANNGRTSLHEAASRGHTEVCKVLLSVGSDIDIRDDAQWTPLFHAAKKGHVETVQLLLHHGADVSATRDGWTSLHWAAFKGHIALCNVLLSAGAQVNQGDSCLFTPLHLAASRRGNLSLVRRLLQHGADVTLMTRDGETAFDRAKECGHPDIAAYLSAAQR